MVKINNIDLQVEFNGDITLDGVLVWDLNKEALREAFPQLSMPGVSYLPMKMVALRSRMPSEKFIETRSYLEELLSDALASEVSLERFQINHRAFNPLEEMKVALIIDLFYQCLLEGLNPREHIQEALMALGTDLVQTIL